MMRPKPIKAKKPKKMVREKLNNFCNDEIYNFIESANSLFSNDNKLLAITEER